MQAKCRKTTKNICKNAKNLLTDVRGRGNLITETRIYARNKEEVMKTNMMKLKGKMAEKGKTQREVCEGIGMDESTFIRKVKSDGEKFSIGELHRLADFLELTKEECCEIFLN